MLKCGDKFLEKWCENGRFGKIFNSKSIKTAIKGDFPYTEALLGDYLY